MLLVVHSAVAGWLPISSPIGLLATLTSICALTFWLEKTTRWRLFQYVPSAAFMYLIPLVMSNTGVLRPKLPILDFDFEYLPIFGLFRLPPVVLSRTGALTVNSPVFDAMDRIMLPMMLVLLLLNVN